MDLQNIFIIMYKKILFLLTVKKKVYNKVTLIREYIKEIQFIK